MLCCWYVVSHFTQRGNDDLQQRNTIIVRTPESKAIAALAYNPATARLRIKFSSGKTWSYPQCSRQRFVAFRYACSKGGYYNHKFNPAFRGKGRPVYGAAAIV